MRRLRSVVPLGLAAALVGCAGGAPSAFDLNAAKPEIARATTTIFRIRTPITTDDLDSDRILVRTAADGLAVLSGARWGEPLPDLLRARLTASFQNTPGLRVIAEDAAASFDDDVVTNLRHFELDAPARQVVVEIGVKVVTASSGRVVGARDFKASAPVESTTPDVVARALDDLAAGMMADIVRFVAAGK